MNEVPYGRVMGVSWKEIIKATGNRSNIFNGCFYFTQTVRQYEKIVEITGGQIISMNKRKRTSIILDKESGKDQ